MEAQIDLTDMSRKELFRYGKEKGFKLPFNAKKVQLIDIITGKTEAPSESGRRKRGRVPLGTHRSKLGVSQYNLSKDKVARWVNDKPGRLQYATEGGYEHVLSEAPTGEEPLKAGRVGKKVSAVVGTEDDGRPIIAYLMVIDKELYDEDQADKMRELDKTDAAIRGGAVGSQEDDGKYVPSQGIKIETN